MWQIALLSVLEIVEQCGACCYCVIFASKTKTIQSCNVVDALNLVLGILFVKVAIVIARKCRCVVCANALETGGKFNSRTVCNDFRRLVGYQKLLQILDGTTAYKFACKKVACGDVANGNTNFVVVENGCDVVTAVTIQDFRFHNRTGCDNAHDIALDEFVCFAGWLSKLLANGNLFARSD